MIAPAAIVIAMTAMPAPARDLRVSNTSESTPAASKQAGFTLFAGGCPALGRASAQGRQLDCAAAEQRADKRRAKRPERAPTVNVLRFR
jgi:hypothetical protein